MDAGGAAVRSGSQHLFKVVAESAGERDAPAAHGAGIGWQRREWCRPLRESGGDRDVVGGAVLVPGDLPDPEPHEERGAGERDSETEQGFCAHEEREVCVASRDRVSPASGLR